ncbi:hypothetical protein P7K49_022384 [Saguinus oedipus]|uniref:Integrator complex subunit 4 n=1 Tax=Saguinus oedipus TaxID=9490 RepID=A0ABQ9UVB1_SAGOE|nr:hypothetical protein P7K49_022384 [Saguinus oedipus]
MAAHLKKRVYEEFTKVVQQQQEEIATKKLRLTKPSKSAALHIDLCKATSPADALQYLLQFARKPVEAESVEGVVRILLEHYYKENDPSVRLKIASLLGLLSKTTGFSPDCIMDDAINILQNEKSHQVLAQLLDTLLAIGTKLPENQAIQMRLVDVACKSLARDYISSLQELKSSYDKVSTQSWLLYDIYFRNINLKISPFSKTFPFWLKILTSRAPLGIKSYHPVSFQQLSPFLVHDHVNIALLPVGPGRTPKATVPGLPGELQDSWRVPCLPLAHLTASWG